MEMMKERKKEGWGETIGSSAERSRLTCLLGLQVMRGDRGSSMSSDAAPPYSVPTSRPAENKMQGRTPTEAAGWLAGAGAAGRRGAMRYTLLLAAWMRQGALRKNHTVVQRAEHDGTPQPGASRAAGARQTAAWLPSLLACFQGRSQARLRERVRRRHPGGSLPGGLPARKARGARSHYQPPQTEGGGGEGVLSSPQPCRACSS